MNNSKKILDCEIILWIKHLQSSFNSGVCSSATKARYRPAYAEVVVVDLVISTNTCSRRDFTLQP